MIDWGAEIAEKYELEVINGRKGRGSWIFETDHGLKVLKEYKGSMKRLEFEEAVLDTISSTGALRVDQPSILSPWILLRRSLLKKKTRPPSRQPSPSISQ